MFWNTARSDLLKGASSKAAAGSGFRLDLTVDREDRATLTILNPRPLTDATLEQEQQGVRKELGLGRGPPAAPWARGHYGC